MALPACDPSGRPRSDLGAHVPLCRGAKDPASSLSELRRGGHCSSCNIQFDANFDHSVEVTFRPSQQIRRIEEAAYCVGGAGNTPHITLQQSLAPRRGVTVPVELAEGLYRLRGPQMSSSGLIEVGSSHPATEGVSISCSSHEVRPQKLEVHPGRVSLQLENSEEGDLLVLLEKMRWPDDSVTAAQITALQDFRDLFSSEVLAPEEQFEVRYLTFMFTDLRASTALYQERGDAPAYALVRDHFQVLHEWVARHHGAVLKTIGDAVMAVFLEPGAAVAAGLDIHRAFSRSEGAGASGLVLKIGVHAGPCIAVNLNGRLDYFGTTVNMAVRLQGHSLGGDVVVHADTLKDPAVQDVVSRPGIGTEHLNAQLRGFQGAYDICRLSEDTAPGHAADPTEPSSPVQ